MYAAHRPDTHAHHAHTRFDTSSSMCKARDQRQMRLDAVSLSELSGSTDTFFSGRQLPKAKVRVLG